ncbi:lipoate protein ligase C-terminal domain-containing protein, partial [Streptococcus pyogenes]
QMKKEYPDMEEYVLSEDELTHIQEIRDQQFGTWEWTFGTTPEYTVERSIRYPAGTITSYIKTEKSIIESLKIYGDF